MKNERKVVVITGASQGIGAALVKVYRELDYRVVATARSIRLVDDDQILVAPGWIPNRKAVTRSALGAGSAIILKIVGFSVAHMGPYQPKKRRYLQLPIRIESDVAHN